MKKIVLFEKLTIFTLILFIPFKFFFEKIYYRDISENLKKNWVENFLIKVGFLNLGFNDIECTCYLNSFEIRKKLELNFIKNYLEKNVINFTIKKIDIEEINHDDTSKKIISILDEYIKPAVSSDGGNILFDSYDADKKLVKVILQGACSGCPSSTVTLKNGIENMLKEMLSDKVNSVEAING